MEREKKRDALLQYVKEQQLRDQKRQLNEQTSEIDGKIQNLNRIQPAPFSNILVC
jgi:hypothetical protein